MIVAIALLSIALVAAVALIPAGVRAGDRPGEARILSVAVQPYPRAVTVVVENPGAVPVIVGVSLRRSSVRMRLEGGSYVRNLGARIRREALPGNQVELGAVAPRSEAAFTLPADPNLARRAEVVAVIGEQKRLRAIHRLVTLPPLVVHGPWPEQLDPEAARA